MGGPRRWVCPAKVRPVDRMHIGRCQHEGQRRHAIICIIGCLLFGGCTEAIGLHWTSDLWTVKHIGRCQRKGQRRYAIIWAIGCLHFGGCTEAIGQTCGQ